MNKPISVPGADEGGAIVSVVANTEAGRGVGADYFLKIIDSSTVVQTQAAFHYGLARCSEDAGSHVVISPDFNYMPVLFGADGQPTYLYEFVEALDGAVDYSEITESLHLSSEQVYGALTFVRRVMMLNPKGMDPDAAEDAADAQDPALIAALRRGVGYAGDLRVLSPK